MNIQYGNEFIFTTRSPETDIVMKTQAPHKLWGGFAADYCETGKGQGIQTVPSTTSLARLTTIFDDSPVINLRPETYTVGTGDITVLEDGLYLVTTYATVPANSTGIRILAVFGDDEELSRETIVTTPGVFCRINHNIPLVISAGTVINVRYAQNSGVNLTLAAAFISVHKLGVT